MSLLLIDVGFAVAMASAGGLAGWWLRGSTIRRDSRRNDSESRRNREVLARLYDLAARVAADVGQHTNRVEEISEELASAKEPESDVVVNAVARLIQNNEQMQQQLVTAQERLRDQARQIESSATEARTDALTGLANRRGFDQETVRRHGEFQRSAHDLSLVMIDVDHFKKFNDVYGHQAGDRVLRGLAQVLLQEARESDLPARYGGEEFALVLPGTAIGEAEELAERVRQSVEARRFHCSGTDLHVTISLGVAQLCKDEDVAALIHRADEALYAAKKAGRNRVCWHDGQTIHPATRVEDLAATSLASPPSEKPQPREAAPTSASASFEPTQSELLPKIVKVVPLVPDAALTSSEGNAEHQNGLCNRTTFCMLLGRRLAEIRRGSEAFSVLLLHVDGYDRIVAKFGQQAGELALRVTMQFLNASFRETDLVSYFQTATFAALLPRARISDAIGVAERLRQAIARCKFPVGNTRFQFTISLAGAEATLEDDTERLLERAQKALDQAIKAGGNRTCLHNGQSPELVDAIAPSPEVAAT
jgi:diguanylate cyclase